MAESIHIPANASRAEIYDAIIPQIQALVETETDLVANLSNVTAVLKEAFDFFWVGFYLKKENQLVLGPFQGPVACTRINFDKGVCGYCYTSRQTVMVPDVDQFPGHIACSSSSRSEIVVPGFNKEGEVIFVIDVDSDKLADFSSADAAGLEEIAKIVQKLF